MRIKSLIAAAAISTIGFGANAGGLNDEEIVIIPTPPVAPVEEGSSLPAWAVIGIGVALVGVAVGSGS